MPYSPLASLNIGLLLWVQDRVRRQRQRQVPKLGFKGRANRQLKLSCFLTRTLDQMAKEQADCRLILWRAIKPEACSHLPRRQLSATGSHLVSYLRGNDD